ncbi:WD40/YVTN/BNR-like repeat-containing protein [Arcticibacter eurypsychrophilus]|uniref:WD40/YVTN/BNR-like repeat-containing protein n=1 Tax=Arcticibacter eurypsychrophilus TaxID=1434752 RepID=UPI00084D6509|nr:YCF48-related protein [Arcticibacter eurypsychrophilus]
MNKIILFLAFFPIHLIAQTFQPIEGGPESSIRGMSVVNPLMVWLSGSNGWTATSKDGGNNWSWKQSAKYKAFDFRGIKAFSATKAVVMSSGTPGLILYTEDGGTNWTETYRNDSKEIFLDGISFYNDQQGLVYGDPIEGKMQLLKTEDGGKHWMNISENLNIPLEQGEASFAASNTGIKTQNNGKTWIITGGSKSRVYYSSDQGKSWEVFNTLMTQGASTQGAYSIGFWNAKTGVITGGDYKNNTVRVNNLMMTSNGGRSWQKAKINPWGFRSCITYLDKQTLIATGTSGTDLSKDGGNTWINLSAQSYNVVGVLKKSKTAVIAGNNGKVAILTL